MYIADQQHVCFLCAFADAVADCVLCGLTRMLFVVWHNVPSILLPRSAFKFGSCLVILRHAGLQAAFLIPISVCVYTTTGGLKATFLSSYIHTVIIYVALCIFAFTVYATGSDLGSPSKVRPVTADALLPTRSPYRRLLLRARLASPVTVIV